MNLLLALTLAGSGFARPEMIVTTDWLAANLDEPSIRIVELRRNGLQDYEQGHIPNAVPLLNDAIRDPKNPPTFLPSQRDFERLMNELGISNDTRVIAYDDRGGLYAARLWWILNYFGHSNTALLDGHLIKWMKEGRPLSRERPQIAAKSGFRATPQTAWLATANDVRAAIGRSGTRIVDARTQAEIEGRDLRGIARGGYIPGAIPVYWEDQLDPEWKTLKRHEQLRRLYESKGMKPSDEVIVYCQVGMRASHDLFVLHLLGWDKLRNYYGAWEEWGNRLDLPIAK